MNQSNRIKFFADIFNEKSWNKFSNNFSDIKIPINKGKALPLDIIRVLVYLLGEEETYDWIHRKISSIDNMSALELANSEDGLKALKAFIMRMPN